MNPRSPKAKHLRPMVFPPFFCAFRRENPDFVLRLASIFNLNGWLAPRYLRYSHLDQTPCESCGISQFSRRRQFLALPPLSSPCRRRWCELPRLDFRSYWTTGTVAPEFRGPTSSTMQIARYFAILSAAKIFLSGDDFWPCRLSRRPYRRHWCELPRLSLGSGWTTGTAALVFRGLTKEDRFPEPLILGQSDGKRSASRWKTSEVVEWLDSRPRGVQHELR